MKRRMLIKFTAIRKRFICFYDSCGNKVGEFDATYIKYVYIVRQFDGPYADYQIEYYQIYNNIGKQRINAARYEYTNYDVPLINNKIEHLFKREQLETKPSAPLQSPEPVGEIQKVKETIEGVPDAD